MEELSAYAWWIFFFFILGYLLIIFEQVTEVSKTGIALLMAVACWGFQFADPMLTKVQHCNILTENLGKISEVLLFLLGALAIVEVVNSHNGFGIIVRSISATSRITLLWVIGLIAFFLSAVLDNLTTTVVLVMLLRKLIEPGEDRWIMGGAVVIAANAGGAWTPIGDVTTTMLWISGKIAPVGVMSALFIPSIVCVLVSLVCLTYHLKGRGGIQRPLDSPKLAGQPEPYANLIFFLGVGSLVFVPVFKALTGLPPLMGMLLGLGVLWVVTDLLHRRVEHRQSLRVPTILSRVDLAGVLFFLGILLAVDTLDTAGLLPSFARWVDSVLPSPSWNAMVIGLASAVVDNVPLVAATIQMYSLEHMAAGTPFWHQIAYAAGTGGSILIIGSAAGIAFMGLESAGFSWWLRRISLPALLGFLAGFGVYLLLLPYTG